MQHEVAHRCRIVASRESPFNRSSIEHPLGTTHRYERIRTPRPRPAFLYVAAVSGSSGHPHDANPNGSRHFFKERDTPIGRHVIRHVLDSSNAPLDGLGE